MRACHCALPYMNPNACKHCINNVSEISDAMKPFEWPIVITKEELEETKKQNEVYMKKFGEVFGL